MIAWSSAAIGSVMTESNISGIAKVRHFQPCLSCSIEGLLQFMPIKAPGRAARWIQRLIRAWLLACPMIGITFFCGRELTIQTTFRGLPFTAW